MWVVKIYPGESAADEIAVSENDSYILKFIAFLMIEGQWCLFIHVYVHD